MELPELTQTPVSTPLSSILLVLLASFIGSFGAVFLKLGSRHLQHGIRGMLNWRLAVGITMFLGGSLPFIIALRQGELSVLYPMVSLPCVDHALVAHMVSRTDYDDQDRSAGAHPGWNYVHWDWRDVRTALRMTQAASGFCRITASSPILTSEPARCKRAEQSEREAHERSQRPVTVNAQLAVQVIEVHCLVRGFAQLDP